MKKTLLSMTLFYIVLQGTFSQIRVEHKEDGKLLPEGGVYPTKTDYPLIELPQFDFTELQERSQEREPNVPFQFGKAFEMNLNLENGEWFNIPEGKVWKMRISSKDAYSINLVFSRIHLAQGSRMFIYNESQDMLMGPFDQNNANTAEGELITDLLKGSSITVELFEPSTEPVSELVISKVVHGFINTFSSGFGQSAPCNIDIDCPVGQPFAAESNAVSRLMVNTGQSFCSGALVNNTCNDLTPYLLTANHCLQGNPGGFVFNFQYRSPTPRCDGQGGGGDTQVSIFYNGSQLVANHADTDFGLLLMNTRPDHENVSALGWSRNIGGITNTAGIHHPRGDLMKISIDNNAPLIFPGNFLGTPADTHWEVNFDIGTVEEVSSGSPLLDHNSRVIGQLHGIHIIQTLPFDGRCIIRDGFYGRFDISWGRDQNGNFLPGRNAANSLAPWLDPNNTNAMTTNTIPIPSISGPDYLCSSTSFTLQDPPQGATVSWTAPSSLFSPDSGSGTTANTGPASVHNRGFGTINFLIETDCGEVEITKTVWVGTPSFTNPTVNGDPYITGSCHGVCPGFHQAEVTIGGIPDAVPPDVNWQLSGGPVSWSWDHFTSRITFEVQPMTPFPFSFNGTATNPCGSTPFTFCFISGPNCPLSSYALSPNPADEEVTVTNLAAKDGEPGAEVEIQIISQAFESVLSIKAQGPKISVPTGHLPNGQYILQISDENGVYRKHLIIRH